MIATMGARALPGRVYTLSGAARLAGLTIKQGRTAASRGCPYNLGYVRHGRQTRKLYDPVEVSLYRHKGFKRWYHDAGEPDMRAGVIYAICEPDGAIRYIGKTGDFKRRVRGHKSDWYKRRSNPYLCRWANKLIRQGMQPVFRILQECLPGTMDECEREWIARGKAKGWRLCNMNEGGEGGKALHDDARRRISEISKARWQTPEYRERWQKATGARILSHEERERRELERQQGIAIRERNMAIHAARVAEAEKKKRWVFVPLTHNSTAFVPLTNGKWALIDKGDWERVSQHRWSATLKQGGGYWRAKTNVGKMATLLNRFVMQAGKDQYVRHLNGDQLDCMRSNLIASGYGI